MDCSEWFNDPQHADVRLHLSTAAAAASALPESNEKATPAEAKKREDKLSPAGPADGCPSPPFAMSYHAHALVLSTQSEYFKTRFSDRSSEFRPDLQPAAGGSSSSSSSIIRFELVEHVEEEELEAMELLLRCMYSGRVDQPQDKAPSLFLKALDLAHRFLASKACVGALAEPLASTPTEAIDQGFLTAVFQARMRDAMALPSLAPLLTACRDRLQQLYGDVPGVIKSDVLRVAFCSLPHAAVLSWLQLPGLRVHSENCVVLLLSHWVEAREQALRPCSPAELEQLAREVRVGDVSPACLTCLLPRLSLFEGLKQFMSLLNVSLRCKGQLSALSCLSSPPPRSWLVAPRTRCPDPFATTLSWSLDAGQLEELYADEKIYSPPIYCNGFWMHGKLSYVKCEDPAALGTQLALFTSPRMNKWPSSLSSLWEQEGCMTFSSKVQIGGATSQAKALLSPTSIINRSFGWGWPSALESNEAATVQELVAPYLEQGRLNFKVEVKQVDKAA